MTHNQQRRFRVLFESGEEREVTATSHDAAEQNARYFVHMGERTPTIADRGPVWSVIDLAEYPDPS